MIAEAGAPHPQIRRLVPDDLDRVMEIEVSSYPFPWTRGIFDDCIRVGYDCWGLRIGPVLVAYCIRTHAAGECHLLNLCVAAEWRGRGLGELLLEHALRSARQQDCDSMFLEVRPGNQSAIALYRKHGFVVVGRRKDYYSSDRGREDAIVMRIELGRRAVPG